MENQPTKSDNLNKIFVDEIAKGERNAFIFWLIIIVASYTGITFWLNTVRATWPIWFVWVMIIVQFILYFSIFISSYNRASVIGLNKTLGFFVFVALAVLGRVNNWELLIIPLLVIIMVCISLINKNISEEGKKLLPKQ
jgi:hypothetical protein